MDGMNQENLDSGSGLKDWVEGIYTAELLKAWENADCQKQPWNEENKPEKIFKNKNKRKKKKKKKMAISASPLPGYVSYNLAYKLRPKHHQTHSTLK